MWQLNLGIVGPQAALLGGGGGGGGGLDGSESDGTNLFPGGTTFATGWTTSVGINGSALIPNATLAPDGTTTAVQADENTGNSRHMVYVQTTITGSFTFSVYAKMNGRRYLQLLSGHDTISSLVYLFADLQAGAITDSGVVGSGTLTSASIATGANGFYKVTLVGQVAAGSNFAFHQIILSSTATYASSTLSFDAATYLGSGPPTGVYLWRPKLVD